MPEETSTRMIPPAADAPPAPPLLGQPAAEWELALMGRPAHATEPDLVDLGRAKLREEFDRGFDAGLAVSRDEAAKLVAKGVELEARFQELLDSTALEAVAGPAVTIRIVGCEDQPSLTVEYGDEPPPSELTVFAQRLVTGYLAATSSMRGEPSA